MRLLKSPLFQFLVAGSIIYAVSVLNGVEQANRFQIQVSAGHVQSMAYVFEQTWLRPPTSEELDALVEEFVREEVLYREALAAGLHENDQVVRLRLQQQLELVTQDLIAAIEPSEQDLVDWLEQHPEQFMSEPALSFEQIYLSPQTISEDPGAVGELLEFLGSVPDALQLARLGDQTQLPSQMDTASVRQIERVFGVGFAAQLADVQPDDWSGPLTSGYGSHLVRILDVAPATLPGLQSIRADVEIAWRAARRKELDDRYYAELRLKYTVEIEDALGAR